MYFCQKYLLSLMYTLNCKGKLLMIEKPLVMGIINATPDSFYKGPLAGGTDSIMLLVDKMINEGTDIIDVGGQSTRPGSERISAADEIERVLPVIENILSRHPAAIISIDTYQSKVAEAAVKMGASIINDISGGTIDKDMISAAGSLKVPYVCMHIKGSPETMQQDPRYKDVVAEMLDFFIGRIEKCTDAGITDLIIDPGFGFGKTIAHNFEILRQLAIFNILKKPILAGLSRKSTIYKTLKISVEEALNGTTVLNTIALLNGASILRVHDVKEARQAVDLLYACQLP